jgi:hypothetical protein
MACSHDLQLQQQLGIKRQKLLNLRDTAMEKRAGVMQGLMQQQQQQQQQQRGGASVQVAAAAAERLPRGPSFASPGLQRSASFMLQYQQQQQQQQHSPAAGGGGGGPGQVLARSASGRVLQGECSLKQLEHNTVSDITWDTWLKMNLHNTDCR